MLRNIIDLYSKLFFNVKKCEESIYPNKFKSLTNLLNIDRESGAINNTKSIKLNKRKKKNQIYSDDELKGINKDDELSSNQKIHIDEVNIQVVEFLSNEITFVNEYFNYLKLLKQYHENCEIIIKNSIDNDLQIYLQVILAKSEYEMSLQQLNIIYNNPISIILSNCINHLENSSCYNAQVIIITNFF